MTYLKHTVSCLALAFASQVAPVAEASTPIDWSTYIGGSYQDDIREIAVDPDGNIVFTGITTSPDLPTTAGVFGPVSGNTYDEALGERKFEIFVGKLNTSGTELMWLGYLGGVSAENDIVGFNSLAVDDAGDVYVGGFTRSADFPLSPASPSHSGATDVFVTKISSDGSAILWSTLIGGSADDWGLGLALDAQHHVYLTGFTLSSDFPTTAGVMDFTLGGGQDAFVCKLDASGNLVWSSFLGGDTGLDRAGAVLVDAHGDVILFGDTFSSDFPVTAGAYDTSLNGANDVFLSKISADGSHIVWSTFLGGSEDEGKLTSSSAPHAVTTGAIALAGSGDILVTGETASVDFPVTSGAFDSSLSGTQDAFVSKISADGGQLLWASFLGGSSDADSPDSAWDILENPWGEIYVSGRTGSSDFPVTADALQTSFQGGSQDGFLSKFSADASTLIYSTYLGGSQHRDAVLGLAYDPDGGLIAGGWTFGSLPVTAGAVGGSCRSCASGRDDAFLMRFLDAYVAHDDFESGVESGGSGGWLGDWAWSGDASIQNGTADAHSGRRYARLRRNSGYLERVVDVSGATSAHLGFWAKVSSFESGDRASVRVSQDGSSYATLREFTEADSDENYHYVQLDLSAYLGTGTVYIAFEANMNHRNDALLIDDVRIQGFLTAGNLAPVADSGVDVEVTDADEDGVEAVVLDGSSSFDLDGSIVTYEWAEGGTVIGSAAVLTASFAVGVHTLTLTVVDDQGATATDSVVVSVLPGGASGATVHVDSIGYTTAARGKHLVFTVALVDDQSVPVANASVSIDLFRDGNLDSQSTASTGSDGTVSFQRNKAPSGNYTAVITGVSAPELTWDGATPTNGYTK